MSEVLGPTAFTVVGAGDTSVNTLLVVGATGFTDLAPDTAVGGDRHGAGRRHRPGRRGGPGDRARPDALADRESDTYLVAEDVTVLATSG